MRVSAQQGASPFHRRASASASAAAVEFLRRIQVLDAKRLCLWTLPFERCLRLVCFELHYRLECDCGGSIFILPGGAANHSYMLQRIYNCVVLCVCVFNGISEVLWAKNTHDFKFTIMVCAPSLQFFIYFKNCLLIKF